MNSAPDERGKRLIEVFNEARDLPVGMKRDHFLEKACGQDEHFRAELDSLLRAGNSAGDYLQGDPAVSPGLEAEFARLKPEESGERIGHYQLVRQIGEGGFGIIWMAEQSEPVKRTVALKIIKLGMDTKEVIARFEQERQALAMMDHPNIARVYDAGATPTGRPFFVMELVRGVKITEYCDQANLSNEARLRLLIAVCQAVQHAHQKGIIHRDLKPSNILVPLHDGMAVPKVIDFGVAKATQSQRLTDLTFRTQVEQMIGTPLYMSPEQAEMSGLDVDTRSDIYSLGVLLYELLTGRTPFDPERMMRQGRDEVRRAILEQEPQKPSTFVQTMPVELRTTVARYRRVDAEKLAGMIRGDLDWIVMKALEKDRARRYETANGLAADLQRHLNHEPVGAFPPSRVYRFRKMIRRNRLAFTAAAAVAIALIVGLGFSTWGFLRAETQRQLAEQATGVAQASTREAAANESRARHLLAVADLNLAQQALAVNNLGYARRLLDRHRPANRSMDPRGDWTWRFLWQQCRGNALAVLTTRAPRAFSVSVSHDGTRAAVGYADGHVALLDVNERKLIRVLSDGGGVSRVAFAPTQPLLVFSSGGSVKQLDLVTGDVIVLCEAIGTVRDLAFSPAGNLLAVLSEGNDQLFVIATDSRRRIFQQPSPGAHQHFNNARFSLTGDRLWHTYGAFSRGDKTPGLRCINLADGKTLWDVPIGELEGVVVENGRDLGFSAMDVSPSGRVLVTATGYNDPTISVRDAVTGTLIKKLRGHTGWIGELRFSRDGRVLASAAADQTMRLWDTAKWQRKFDPFRGHNDEVHTVAFAPDDSFVISGGKDGAVILWDAHRQPPPGGRLELPDITAAVPVGGASAMCVRKIDGATVQLDLATFSETPIEGSTPDLVANESLGTAPSQLRGKISASQLSPDGKLRAVSTEDGFIMLYDAPTQQEVGTLHGHMQAIFGVAFSPDNQVLASTSGGDEAVRLWDLNTLQPLLTLPGVGTLLKSVHFTADGNVLLVGEPGKAGSFQFWRAPSWDEIAEVERATGIWPSTTDYKVAPVAAAAPMDIESLRKLWERDLGILESDPGTSEVQSARDRGRALKQALATLATSLKSKGKLTEAAAVREEELVVERKLSGPEHPATVTLMHTLAISYEEADRPDEAIRLYAESLPGARKFTGADQRKATNAIGRLADLYAKADRWDEALPLLAELCARRPKDSVFAQKVTTLQAWFQKDADHAVTCRRIMDLAKGTDDPSVADRAAKAYCLRPSSDPHLLEVALTLARHSVEIGKNRSFLPYYHLVLGMAEYRAGSYSAADEALRDAIRGGGGVPIIAGPARFFHAMSLFRQGKDEEARNRFSEAATKMKPMPADERQPLANGAGLDDLIVWLAYKEAKALLQLGTQTAPTKPEGTTPP